MRDTSMNDERIIIKFKNDYALFRHLLSLDFFLIEREHRAEHVFVS
tara:strand:+ start:2224 stop:2361 length:138 start_codon:yes stop_codon:yes gene_type:complete